jgi:hypothetical protein
MADAPIPSVVAMLICDQIITEQVTNKKSLVGVFDNFYSLNFPTLFKRLAVYVKLADAIGDYLFRLRIVRLKDEGKIAEIGIQAHIEGESNQYSELALNMGDIPIPEPGKYEFQLYSGEDYLHRITMQAILQQLPQGGPQWPPQK